MDPQEELKSGNLVWFQSRGYGYVHPVDEIVYGKEYFNEYEDRSKNEVSDSLMKARALLVNEYTKDEVVDVGTGSGAFIKAREKTGYKTFGYDINPYTVHRLIEEKLFWNPFENNVNAACFWDTLEHFQDPAEIINCVRNYIFISIPIFENMEHAKKSKHYKPGEHIWYFTRQGLINFMNDHDFMLRNENRVEEQWREDIGTFVFERRGLFYGIS